MKADHNGVVATATTNSLEELHHIMNDESLPDKDRIAAARIILNQAYGPIDKEAQLNLF